MNNEYTYDEEELEEDEFHGLTEEQYDFIIDSFRQCLTGFTYDSWCEMGSKDKEEFVALATLESCPFEVDEDTIYNIFWEWADGLEEDSFPESEEDEEEDYLNQDFDDCEDEEEDDDDWY